MPDLQAKDWKNLFARIANSDGTAFEVMYNYFYPKLFAVAFAYVKNRQMAEDTVQQILLRVWEKRAELHTVSHPATWLYTAAKYEIWEAFRKQVNTQKREALFAESFLQSEKLPGDAIIFTQQHKIIEDSIRSLSLRQQQVYRMGREQGMSYLEIAGKLNISRETVKELMANALKNLRKSLDNYKDELLLVLFSLVDCTLFT